MAVHSNAELTSDVLTVTLDSKLGAEYDAVLLSQDMSGLADLLWIPARELIFCQDDDIVIAFDNTDGATVGVVVMWAIVYGGP